MHYIFDLVFQLTRGLRSGTLDNLNKANQEYKIIR